MKKKFKHTLRQTKEASWKELIIAVSEGKMTVTEAAFKAGVTARCISYRLNLYRKKGDKAFIHGNTGRKHYNEAFENDRMKIADLLQNYRVNNKNPFEGITYKFCKIMLEEEFDINRSVSAVKEIMNTLGLFTPIRHRCKKAAGNHPMRERKKHTGELVQADGTEFDWFGTGEKFCIQGFLDDATGIPVGMTMTKHECLLGYLESFRTMAEDFGLPETVYPDRAAVFFVPDAAKKSAEDGKEHLTQFGRIMKKFGVGMIPAYSPEAKGRIERFWETVQNRLVNYFKFRGIDTVEKANEFLHNDFPELYRKWFPVEAESDESYFVKADMNEVNACLKASYSGHTDKGGVFSLMGYRFFCRELINKKITINLSEREGLWVTDGSSEKHFVPVLLETDTTGRMPEVMQDLIDRTFLKHAKPKYREVYIDIDDIALTE